MDQRPGCSMPARSSLNWSRGKPEMLQRLRAPFASPVVARRVDQATVEL